MRQWIGHIPKPEARAALLSVAVGISLLGVKFAAYFLTQSAAIFSDAVESIVNVLASAVALYALRLAHMPADQEHPYGHGKVEFLSAWFEGGMILLAAVFIVLRTADAMYHRELVLAEKADWGLLLVAFAMLINAVVGWLLLHTGKKHNSMTLIADGRHLLTDVYTSIAALAAMAIVKYTGWQLADPLMAMGMAGFIGYTGISLLRGSTAGLMDKQDRQDETRLRSILDAHLGPNGKPPHICNYHKLRHRHSGRYMWIDFHVRVPASMSVHQAHDVASNIEEEIEDAFGPANATAHIEPCSPANCQLTHEVDSACPDRPSVVS